MLQSEEKIGENEESSISHQSNTLFINKVIEVIHIFVMKVSLHLALAL